MIHAKIGLVSWRDHPKSPYSQMAVVEIAQRNIEENTLSSPFMIISESLLDWWSAFHSDFFQVIAVECLLYWGKVSFDSGAQQH